LPNSPKNHLKPSTQCPKSTPYKKNCLTLQKPPKTIYTVP
jgi:hypothetical protein